MKSKRQTIWLVSMLSLMVILSAYYLFTNESPTPSKSADGQQVSTVNDSTDPGATAENSGQSDDDAILSEVSGDDGEGAITDDSTTGETAGITDETAADGQDTAKSDTNDAAKETAKDSKDNAKETADTTAKDTGDKAADKGINQASGDKAVTDEDVLNQMDAQGASAADSLTNYQFERTQENSKKADELMKTINDENKTLEEATMAQQQLGALEEKEAKINGIEEKLQQQYANAVVSENDNMYKVVVVSEKLEAKEAVSIMDLVMKELGVSQDKVSVQYVTQ